MKRLVSILLLALALVSLPVLTVGAAGPAKPVINGQMPDCYMPLGSTGLILFTNVSVSDGGIPTYQWYVSDTENMAMIRAIDGADGESYSVPEELGVKWYCYAAWNVAGGSSSEPTYSRLIRVEFYDPNPHTHSFGEWMVTTKPTCTEAGIKTRECDCGATERVEIPATGHRFGEWMVTTKPACTEAGIKTRECDCGATERAEVPATGHSWDTGKITKEPTDKADGERIYTCLTCQETKTEPVPYSGGSAPKPGGENATAQTPPEENAKAAFPWWIAVAVAVPIIGGGVAAIVVAAAKKKQKPDEPAE